MTSGQVGEPLVMTWTEVCSIDEVPDAEGRRFDVAGTCVAVFRVGSEFFATDDACTHGQSSLADGYVEPDCSVECVAHMARFSLRTGEVLAPPASVPLRVHSTRIDGSHLFVRLEG